MDRTERLLNLLFCLMAADTPVSRQSIRGAIADYRDSPSPEAFERKFERDKDELRGMGIPVETVVNAHGETEGYRIPSGDYALPPLEVTPAELGILSLAARAWESASLQPAAQMALRKVEAAAGVSAAASETPRVAIAPVISSSDAPSPDLIACVRDRREITFDYRRPDQHEPTARRLRPWGVVSWKGAWHVVGWDVDRDDIRIFRLSRCMTPPRPTGAPGAFDVPADLDVRELVRQRIAARPSVTAVLHISPSRALPLRQRGQSVTRDGIDMVEVTTDDVDRLASEIASYADAVRVIEPAELRAAVVDLLSSALRVHEPA